MNAIAQILLDTWKSSRKTRVTPSQWITNNCVCCDDKRRRAGFKYDPASDRISYHCFNCNFSTSYAPGMNLSHAFRKLLDNLNIPDETVGKIKLTALRLKEAALLGITDQVTQIVTFETVKLPPNSRPIVEWIKHYQNEIPSELVTVAEYLASRQLFSDTVEWYWTPHKDWNTRAILPFTYYGRIVGYTARSAIDERPKYVSKQQPGYVFGLDFQTDDRAFVIVAEGPLDAISIDGCSILGREISKMQSEFLSYLERPIVYVPDKDEAGIESIEAAIEKGWLISFPEWDEGIKDINEAVIKDGKLLTLQRIINGIETSPFKMRLRTKMEKR